MPATLCAQARPDSHQPGETCRYAADLRPGDQVAVITGIFMTVYSACPADGPNMIDLHYDATGRRPALATQIHAHTLASVIPADGLTTQEQYHQDQRPTVVKLLNLPDCVCSWTYIDTPCCARPAFAVTGFDKVERLACLEHAGHVLAEVTGPDQAASVIEYEGE
ncbi:hypothetical protein ABZ930_30985 [Streptomyces sp. NPDC046716]|uniref:hypothetical protein n=1 Tax=Streptomyces sp. NPDC046716 TaxID=3157093 RepID=UPI0033D44BA9